MIAISLLASFFVCFVAGMNFEAWLEDKDPIRLCFAATLSLLGIWNLISLVGYAVKVH